MPAVTNLVTVRVKWKAPEGRLLMPPELPVLRPNGYQSLRFRPLRPAAPPPGPRLLVPLPHTLEEKREQVHEVEVERQRAENGRALCDLPVHGAIEVFALEPLGIPGRQAREHQHTDDRDHPLHRRAAEEQVRSEEHTSELQSRRDLVCRLLLEKK